MLALVYKSNSLFSSKNLKFKNHIQMKRSVKELVSVAAHCIAKFYKKIKYTSPKKRSIQDNVFPEWEDRNEKKTKNEH